jgi:hypothetical protein
VTYITATQITVGGGGLFDAYALLREEQVAGTDAGTFTGGSFVQRVLNIEKFDPGNIVTLSSNRFTLAGARNYFIRARAPAFGAVRSHVAKLVADPAGTPSDAIVGAVTSTSTTFDMSDTIVIGRITPAVTTTYEIQHRGQNTQATNGLGLAANFGVTEVYTEVEIWRET